MVVTLVALFTAVYYSFISCVSGSVGLHSDGVGLVVYGLSYPIQDSFGWDTFGTWDRARYYSSLCSLNTRVDSQVLTTMFCCSRICLRCIRRVFYQDNSPSLLIILHHHPQILLPSHLLATSPPFKNTQAAPTPQSPEPHP